jgi:hypothetical protein
MSTRGGTRGDIFGFGGGDGGGAGHTHDPQSFTLTHDVNEDIETVTVASDPTWTLSRNPNRSVASLTNTIHLVTINRDGSGRVTGATAVEL